MSQSRSEIGRIGGSRSARLRAEQREKLKKFREAILARAQARDPFRDALADAAVAVYRAILQQARINRRVNAVATSAIVGTFRSLLRDIGALAPAKDECDTRPEGDLQEFLRSRSTRVEHDLETK